MILFTWLLLLVSVNLAQTFVDVNTELYYEEPVIPLRGFNFTFIAGRPLTGVLERDINEAALKAGTALCQTVLINKNLTDIKLDGTLNFAELQYNSIDQTSQYAQMMQYERLLYNRSTNEPLNPNIVSYTSFFGLDGNGNSRINAAITGGNRIPISVPESLAASDPIDNLFYFNEFANQTAFEVQASTNITVFQATVSFLEFMNWTLVGTVYEATIFGYSNQARVKDYQEQKREPYFACGVIFEEFLQAQMRFERGKDFCSCLQNFQTISVIVLFATLNNALVISNFIKESCNIDFTYITCAENTATPNSYLSDAATPLSNGFLIRAFYNWDFRAFVQSCYDAADEADATVIYDSYEQFFRYFADCSLGLINPDNLPICERNRTRNSYACICNEETFSSSSLGLSQLFYTADGVSLLANGLSLLQNNCTFLNENQLAYNPNGPAIDFCSLTTITPPIFNLAMRMVNFTGYTGSISFPTNTRARLIRDFYIYQFTPSFDNSSYIGNYSIYGENYNASAISFPNGQVPFSAIKVNNPSLSEAVVAVNFGLAIAFMVAFAAVFIVLVANHNHPVLRKNASLLTEIMCLGAFLHALNLFFVCFGAYDAICWLDVIISAFAFALYIGVLLAKNLRIYRIFTQRGAVAVHVKTSTLLLYVTLVLAYYLLIELFVLLVGFSAKERYAKDNPFYAYMICEADSEAFQLIYSILNNVSRLLFLVCVCILSFFIRKVHSAYNESTAVAVIAYTYLMTYILLTPLEYILSSSTDSESLRFLIRAEQLVIICVIALFIYFLPLLWRMKNYKEQRRGRLSR